MKKQLLGYYSHSKKTFNTLHEINEYTFIINRYNAFIVCPNKHLNFPSTNENNPHSKLIANIDYMIVSVYNGTIGRGSFNEVKQALERGIPVHEIFPVGRSFKIRSVIGIEVLHENNLFSYAKLVTEPLKNFHQ